MKPDPNLAQVAAQKAYTALCYEINSVVMEDDRPEVYEEALALLTEKVKARAEAFRATR